MTSPKARPAGLAGTAVALAAFAGALLLAASLADAAALGDRPLGIRFAWTAGPANLAMILAVALASMRRRRSASLGSQEKRGEVFRTGGAGDGALLTLGLLVVAAMAWPLSLALTSANSVILLGGSGALIHRLHRACPAPPWRRGGRFLRATPRALLLLAGAAAWLPLLAVVLQIQLGLVPLRLLRRVEAPGARAAPVTLTAADGIRLRGVYHPGETGMPGIVLCHGIGDNRDQLLEWAQFLAGEGYHVLRFDFRAHGESGGVICSVSGRETIDIRAAAAWLGAVPGIDEESIFLFGNSMGGGAALAAGALLERPGLRGVIAMAPASDLVELARHRLHRLGPLRIPLAWVAARWCRLLTGLELPDISADRALERAPRLPLLVFHGSDDRTIPPRLTRALEERFPDTLEAYWLPGVRHNPLSLEVLIDEEHRARVLGFIEEHRNRKEGGGD
ncbi:MAG: alpha/beta hydrolase [Planctomycetota bacterium]